MLFFAYLAALREPIAFDQVNLPILKMKSAEGEIRVDHEK